MEGNRDEAYRCIDIATNALSEGKIEKAEKFLLKAERLFSTKEAQDLLSKLKSTPKNEKTSPPSSPKGPRRRQGVSPNGAKTDSKPSEPEYTSDQLEAVKKIKKCKDYYEVLGVTKEATDSEIKKAYKKLALQLHPDKNKAPGSIEAFKAVGNAVAILTNPEKRKSYDLYGAEEQANISSGRTFTRHSYEYGYTRGFEADVTADDLFNMFFGGGAFPQQNVYMRQRRFHRAEHANHNQREQQSSYAALINLLPILLLIMLSMMSSFFISDPIYSLQPSQKYSVARKTNALKIPYYVKDNFHTEYQGSVGRLETAVEEDYIQTLKHSCYRERNYKESMLMKARNFGDKQLYHKAQSITTPSCENLQKLQNS